MRFAQKVKRCREHHGQQYVEINKQLLLIKLAEISKPPVYYNY